MRVFILCDDLTGEGPVWLNILWPMYRVFRDCFDVVHLPVPPRAPSTGLGYVDRAREALDQRRVASTLCDTVRAALDPNGPNILMAWAGSARILEWSRTLAPVWDQFSHKAVHVCDTVHPDHMRQGTIERFDVVTCFCADLLQNYGTRVRKGVFWPAHVDTVNYHQTGDHRPIDLILVGRRDLDLHGPLHRHFNAPNQDRIFLDFVTRTQGPTSCEAEFALLMSTYGKSTAAFCYEPSTLPRYKGASPLLARWVHAWAAGTHPPHAGH